MEGAARRFFTAPYFAVVGASQDQSKFGYKILAWYHSRSLPVTPINPSRPSISFPSKSYSTVKSPSVLPNPSDTALSFLTPPSITRQVLEEAKQAGVKAVWLQPGSFDSEAMQYAEANFDTAVGGNGWCVLVDGEQSMHAAGRDFQRQKL